MYQSARRPRRGCQHFVRSHCGSQSAYEIAAVAFGAIGQNKDCTESFGTRQFGTDRCSRGERLAVGDAGFRSQNVRFRKFYRGCRERFIVSSVTSSPWISPPVLQPRTIALGCCFVDSRHSSSPDIDSDEPNAKTSPLDVGRRQGMIPALVRLPDGLACAHGTPPLLSRTLPTLGWVARRNTDTIRLGKRGVPLGRFL